MIKERIYQVVEKGAHGSKANLIFDYAITLLILLNVAAIVFESVPEVSWEYVIYLRFFEIVSVLVFTIEYILRLYVSDLTHPSTSRFKSMLKFMFSGYGIVDLMAIVPFYLPLIFKTDLRFLRLFRLLRLFQVLKINRYHNSLSLIWSVIKEKRAELGMTVFATFLTILISSFLMYYIEGSVQPDKFPNILAGFWWAIATLTTVGYGDVYPITGMGKLLSGFVALLGIGLVALPTGIIGAGFMEKIARKKAEKKCPHCGKDL